MKRFLLLLSMTALMMGCTRTICVMTYNVGAFGKYKENSIPDVAAAVRAAGQ